MSAQLFPYLSSKFNVILSDKSSQNHPGSSEVIAFFTTTMTHLLIDDIIHIQTFFKNLK